VKDYTVIVELGGGYVQINVYSNWDENLGSEDVLTDTFFQDVLDSITIK
jgi:hypothetical protein